MILIHPDNVYVFSYIGGGGGEFLCGAFTHSPEFLRGELCPENKNTYSYRYIDIDINAAATDQRKIILPAHGATRPGDFNKPIGGNIIPPQARYIWADGSEKYRKFYYTLFWIKTALKPMLNAELSDEFILDLEINRKRSWPREFELHHWQQHKTLPKFYEEAFTGYQTVANSAALRCQTHYEHYLSLDELFFGDFDAEYDKFCKYVGCTPADIAMSVREYHQRNVQLVEAVAGMPIGEFVELRIEQAWPYIFKGLDQLHFSVNEI